MKAILMSIQPKWCELIASGKKTVEVRKTRPKIETPFKVYIYCTNNGGTLHSAYDGLHYHKSYIGKNDSSNINGKVIGEFVCDEIDTYDDDTIHAFSHEDYSKWNDFDLYNSCIHPEDFERYANDNWLYGWHISNLIIYDEPKELSEFFVYCDRCDKRPIACKFAYERSNENGYYSECMCDFKRPIERPPQAWCYVEEKAGADND